MSGPSQLSRDESISLLSQMYERVSNISAGLTSLSEERLKNGFETGQREKIKESPPLAVYKIVPNSIKWRFKTPIPDDLKEPPERLWYVKTNIRQNTYMENGRELLDESYLPSSFRLWEPSTIAKRLIPTARDEIKKFMASEVSKPVHDRLPHGDAIDMHGFYLLFGTPAGVKILYKDGIKILYEHVPQTAKLCEEYANMICQMYHIPIKKFGELTQLQIMRYEPNHAIWQHLDNIARYDRGPIITASLGPKVVYYDLAPTLIHDEKAFPIRVKFHEGVLAAMDGPARMQFAHGLPLDAFKTEHKISILFKMDHIDVCPSGHVPELRTDIYETPIDPSQVITHRPLPISHCCVNPHANCELDSLFQKLHSKLQMVESRLAVFGCM